MIYNMLGLSLTVLELFSFFGVILEEIGKKTAKIGKNVAVLEQRAYN